MSILKDLCGSYCKVALVPSNSSKGIVQSGFIKNVDTINKIITLENENGIVRLSFQEIRAVKKIKMNQNG
jgi:hypothetical protein